MIIKIVFFLFFLTHAAHAVQNSWMDIAGGIEKSLQDAMILYESGKTDNAMEKVADTYFGMFENEKANMEIAVRKFLSLKRAAALEKGFGDLRKGMFNKIAPADIKKQAGALIDEVKRAAGELDRKGVKLSSEF